MKGRTRLTSLDEAAASIQEVGEEVFLFHDVLARDAEDLATRAARKLDWESFCAALPERERGMVEFLAQGKTMANGPRKGGDPQVLDILRSSPGLLDLWQSHFSPSAGDKNAPADFIANPEALCEGKTIRVSAQSDGTFTVTNLRNSFSKTYKP